MRAFVTHSYIWNRYAAKTFFQASLTKIERQEIVSSIEYYIIFITVFVDKFSVLAREAALFWQENVEAVVILLRVLARMS